MNTILIAICEDEPAQAEYLKKVVTEYYAGRNIKTVAECFADAEELLFKYPESLPFSCLLLDIKLKTMNGMQLAGKIRERDNEIKIIFITGYRDYVFDGYRVGAARYLLKPIKSNELAEALQYVITKEAEGGSDDYICINYSGEYTKISRQSIIYVKVTGHYITIKTDNKDYTYKETMKDIISFLDDGRFVRANRSVLVNLQNVEQITRDECLCSGGERISVSRGCYGEINRRFIEFYGGRL